MIADARLRHLFDDDVGESENGVVKHTAAIEQVEHDTRFDREPDRRSLDKSVVWHLTVSQHDRQTDHAFKARITGLDRSSLFRHAKQRDHAAVRKETGVDDIAGAGERCSWLELYGLE